MKPACFSNFFKPKSKSGQTLIEIIISVGLAAMVITALLVLSAASSKVGSSSLKRTQASKIAVLASEAVRYYRDSDGYTAITTGCYQINNETGPNSSGALTSANCSSYQTVNFETFLYQRKIEVSPEYTDGGGVSENSRKITVTVRWPESTGTADSGVNYKEVVVNTILGRW